MPPIQHKFTETLMIILIMWVVALMSGVVSVALAQAPSGPSKLDFVVPKTLEPGKTATATIQLLDARGAVANAVDDLVLTVTASPGTRISNDTVTIPKGSSSTQVEIAKDQPGVSEIAVEHAHSPATIKGAKAAFEVLATEEYKPKPPFRLALDVLPRQQLFAGLDAGTIVATLLDQNNIPVVPPTDVEVSFPGLSNITHSIHIKSPHPYGEADISSSAPRDITQRAVLIPTAIKGKPIVSADLKVKFVSPIVGARIVSEYGSYIPRIWTRECPLRIELLDASGGPISADKDVEVEVHIEPPDVGRIVTTVVTIAKTKKFVDTAYIPYKEGKATIKAFAGSLQIEPVDIEFAYRWWFYGLIALGGGLIGGFLHYYQTTPHVRFWLAIGLGAGAGLLAFTLLPPIVSISFRSEALHSVSKILEALWWGIIGGYGGPALIAKKIEDMIKTLQKPAAS